MKKLQEAIYFKRVDLNELFWSTDKRGIGFINLSEFERVLKLAPITWNPGDIDEIKSLVEKDANNSINYRELQTQMSKTKNNIPNRSNQNKEEEWVFEKVACALNEFLIQIPSTTITFDDFRMIIRKSWLTIPIKQLREIWDVLPHDKFTLVAWAKDHGVPITSFNLPDIQNQDQKESLPIIMTRLKEISLTYGNSLLLSALKAKDWMTKDEFLKLLDKFRVSRNSFEFDEFRLWAVEKGLMRGSAGELKTNSSMLSLYFTGVDYVQKQTFSGDTPIMTQVIQSAFTSIVKEKLINIKHCLEPFSQNDYVEEIRLREILKALLPNLTNENISLIINSLRFNLPATSLLPFRQVNLPEFFSIFDPDSEINIPPTEKPVVEAVITRKDEVSVLVQESFKVKPRDYSWEQGLISQVFQVSDALLCNFRINDWNRSGALTLETFHYTLVKSLTWLDTEQINFLIDLAIRECGSIDEARTAKAKYYPESVPPESISRALFPNGEQFNISYVYFLIVLEKLKL